MPSQPTSGVPRTEQGEPAPRPPPSWENVRVFLEVARCGSFRGAAERLGQSINLIRRRIVDLEREIGITLFTRDARGARLTDEADEVMGAAERMETASFGLVRARDSAAPATAGEVRVAITEGLGSYWLAPRLIEFHRTSPDTLIDLNCVMTPVDVLRHEADIAVQLSRPMAPEVKMTKIGRLHLVLFAGRRYVEAHGLPRSRQELTRHRIVLQAPERAIAREICRYIFGSPDYEHLVAMRTNVSSANYAAIIQGAGVGLLPTYAAALDRSLLPLPIDFHHAFDIWLSYHPDGHRIPRVRQTLDWIIGAFSPITYPWFRDEFIAPADLPKTHRGEPLANLLAGVPER